MDRRSYGLFALFLLFSLYAGKNFGNPNSVTRIGLSHALATRGELTIDGVARHTMDKAFYRGHYYCDKAPGISLLCVPAVFVADHLADWLDLRKALYHRGEPTRRGLLCAYACLGSSSGLLFALAVVAFRRKLLAFGVDPEVAMGLTLLFGLGTPVLMWSTAVFGHAAASALLFLAFCCYSADPVTSVRERRALVAAGLLLGAAVLVELTALPAAVLVGVFLLAARFRLERAVCLVVGASVPLAVLLTYNFAAFDDPLKVGYGAVQGFQGMQTGFFGISRPRGEAAFGILLSRYRGILWLSPVLVSALLACLLLSLRAGPHRAKGRLALAITLYYVVMNAGYYYWDGGYSTGPRHITPIAPFLMFGLALGWDRLGPAFKNVTLGLGVVSAMIVVTCALVQVTAPSDGRPMLTGHVLPKLLRGHSALLPTHVGVRFAVAYALAIVGVGASVRLLLRRDRPTLGIAGEARSTPGLSEPAP